MMTHLSQPPDARIVGSDLLNLMEKIRFACPGAFNVPSSFAFCFFVTSSYSLTYQAIEMPLHTTLSSPPVANIVPSVVKSAQNSMVLSTIVCNSLHEVLSQC